MNDFRSARVVRCGVGAMPLGRVGSEAYMSDRYGMSPSGLVESALRALS